MAERKPYQAGKSVSASQLNATHQKAITANGPPNSMRLPYGVFQRRQKNNSAPFAVLDEAMETDGDAIGEAEATIWSGDPLTDSGTTVTVHNWLLMANEELASGTKVVITMISGKWYVTQASC